MNITIFGGSFNPPTLGHQIVLEQILKLKLIPGLKEIWLLPEYQHSFSKNEQLISPEHRLNMAKLLIAPKIKLQTCCLDQKMSGNTIEHITYLQTVFPQHKFSFLIGSDNLTNFHLWPQYKTLLKLMPFYVYPRFGFGFKPLFPGMVPLTDPRQVVTNISSTMIRNRLQKKLTVEHLLPQKIWLYLQRHRLFFH